ncbi:E3 ubiquitin-protein ligase RAD18 isoform X2 [Mustelus asterias]
MWERLKAMDNLLRCGICFDYFNIAMMIPHCSHNYCSLCVRKFLSYKTQCPICCVTATEPELRNNRILDELVKCFRSARDLLVNCDLQSPPTSPQATRTDVSDKNHSKGSKARAKMKQEMKFMDSFLSRSPSSTPMRPSGMSMEKQCHEEQNGMCSKSITAAPNCLAQQTQGRADATEQPSTSGLKEIVKVNCPVCMVAIPENNINRHLDSCLTWEDKKESLRSSVNQRKLLPKLVYNLISERDLRKKLKECGLPTQGCKAQLVKRHQAFVQMYNSQCDSLNPRSALEIAREIERNEKTQAQLESKASENVLKFTKDLSEEEIDEVHKEYRENVEQTEATDCNVQEVHQDEPQLSESTGSLATPDTLTDEHCSSSEVPASPLSTASSDSDICRDRVYSQEPAGSITTELSNVKSQKRKMRGVSRKRSSENKRTRK